MDEKIFDKVKDLDSIIENTTFSELSDEKKNVILRYMSIEEYNDYRDAILESKNILQSEFKTHELDPNIKPHLLEKLERAKAKNRNNILSHFIHTMNYRLPVYKFGIATSIAIILIMFIRPVFFSEQAGTRIDTVFVERLITKNVPVPDTAEKGIKILIDKQSTSNYKEGDSTDISDIMNNNVREYPIREGIIQTVTNSMIFSNRTKTGRPISEDSLLLKLLVTVY